MNEQFVVHMLNDQGKLRATSIANAFDNLLNELQVYCISGRELAIVKTKLEEACFFAKKAMAINLENQEVKGE